jgi:hypothetical protein
MKTRGKFPDLHTIPELKINRPAGWYTAAMPNFFTLTEANQALSTIRAWMDEVMQIRQRIIDHQPEIWSAVEKTAGNGGNPVIAKMVFDFEKFDALLHKIQDAGAQIKDINIGLLDFPAQKDGREVCLCWKYGEGDIAYWHEVDAGYAGRQPIESF